jgi:large subunit ribosomal protein L29
MRPDEIREMGTEDIAARIRELEEERFRLRFRAATEPLEDPLRQRVIRKDIARLKTILTEREKGIARDGGRGKRDEAEKKSARRPGKKGAAKSKAR